MSFLIDTNVISEVRKGSRCDVNVAAWYASIDDADLHLSVLVLGEILDRHLAASHFRVAADHCRRRVQLIRDFEHALQLTFADFHAHTRGTQGRRRR